MATKTDIELKIVDSVDTSHTEAEVLTDSASNPDAFYVGRGYLAHNGEKVIEGDPNGTYPNMTVGNSQKAKEAEKATHADTATDLSGRVEDTPEVFTYRPSAGEKSIKDDNAFIRRVKGNSIVWNQLVYPTKWTTDSVNGTVNMSDDYSEITHINAGNNSFAYIHSSYINYPSREGHIMYFYAEVSKGYSFYACKTNARDEFTLSPIVKVTNDGLSTPLIAFYKNDGSNFEAGEEITIKNVVLFDLTQMFGAGNEPTTVEEFRALYPDSYYPYNAGELRNLDCSGIKTVGFNQWDEQWEVGSLGTDEYGSPITFDGMIRSTNYNPIFPSTEYYIRTSNAATYIWYYDSDKKYIGRDINPNSRFFITPTNAAYFKLRIGDTTTTITTYNHDICINLHHTGYRDGEYEPYKEVTHALPLSKITNGEPLRKAGSVYDEINETEYIRRVGVVDLGSYDWQETPNGTFFTVVKIPDIKAVESESNYTCKKYIGVGDPSKIYTGTADNLTISTNAAGRIYIRDDAYKTGTAYAYVPALKASLSGVLLHYELAEPIITPIETPIDFNYYVEDFGTEEALLAEDSAPFSADIVYQFNATDQIRNNTRNINKLQKSAFIPKGASSQYIRGDGSYGDRFELSQSTPINDGESEMPDEGNYDMQFTLTPSYYAKSPRELDDTTTIAVFVTAPEDSNYLAEYWFEFAVGETLPNIEYYQPNNSEAVFRIDGDMMTYAVNILHLISSDGGETFFGELKNYVL